MAQKKTAGASSAAGCKAHWSVDPKAIDPETLDLSVNNPNVEAAQEPAKSSTTG